MANKKEEQEQSTLDVLNQNLGSASEKIAENKKVIFWVVGIIAAVAAFVIGYLFIYQNPRTNKAFEEYNEVEIKALGNDSIATAEYMKVADKYGSNDAGILAAISAGEALYNEGKYKEALKYLEQGSKVSEPVLAANIKALIGDCYVNLKNYGAALNWFKDAQKAADKNPQIAPRVLLKQANVYDEQKKYDKALECYKTIQKDYPEFQMGNTSIEAYIALEEARLGK